MGRGTLRYNPADESSPGYRTADPSKLVRAIPFDSVADRYACECGCGEMPRGAKAKFAMGHDARLRGRLIRAHLSGIDVLTLYPGDTGDGRPQRVIETAEAVSDRHGWVKYLREAELKREGKNRQVLQKALGSERLIRVGRWEHTGGQVAAIYRTADAHAVEIEYVTRLGDVRRKRVPVGTSLEQIKQEESPA